MKAFALLIVAVITAGAATFTGVITDSMCGANHAAMKINPEAKCVRDCVKMSKQYKYVLYDGKNSYTLSDQETPAQFAAQRVRVTGTLYPKTGVIKVEKIEPAQASVRK